MQAGSFAKPGVGNRRFLSWRSPQPTVAVDVSYGSGNSPLDQEKAGGRYAADLILQLPARAGSVALHSASQIAPGTWSMPSHEGMK
jgi:hypothetical protein